jgi:hypothetical protein
MPEPEMTLEQAERLKAEYRKAWRAALAPFGSVRELRKHISQRLVTKGLRTEVYK